MLTQSQLLDVAVGDRYELVRAADPGQPSMTAVVESIDPEVMDLLDPYNPTPRFPVRGRQVRMKLLDEENAMMPGETVILRRPRWAFSFPWNHATAP